MGDKVITRVPAIAEDLGMGKGTTVQTRQGTEYTVHLVDAAVAAADIAEMKALDVSIFKRCNVFNAEAEYDIYIYSPTDTSGILPDDGPGSWLLVSGLGGGATGGGTDRVFFENDTTVTADYTISTGRNAVTAGPVTIGVPVDISAISSDGVQLTVVTSTDHNLAVGDAVQISGTTNYNGSYTVDAVLSSASVTLLSALSEAAESAGSIEKDVKVTVPDGSRWAIV